VTSIFAEFDFIYSAVGCRRCAGRSGGTGAGAAGAVAMVAQPPASVAQRDHSRARNKLKRSFSFVFFCGK
jgi:hypothetical protein